MSENNNINQLKFVKKRNLSLEKFDIIKISKAVNGAMSELKINEEKEVSRVANLVVDKLIKKMNMAKSLKDDLGLDTLNAKREDLVKGIFWIEDIQDLVEETLMEAKYFDVAKAYILYRESHAKLRKRDIFQKRLNLKPYEYPELYEYVNAIRHSY